MIKTKAAGLPTAFWEGLFYRSLGQVEILEPFPAQEHMFYI